MASEPASSELPSFFERLMNSRNRHVSSFFPVFLGLSTAANPNSQETENHGGQFPDRIVIINPFTQGMVIVERRSSGGGGDSGDDGSSSDFDSLINELFSGKNGRPPASKASIEALETVEILGGENDGVDDQCVICLEDWVAGEKAKQMPCKHRFHGGCVEKWLKIHGSCPVCRYEMPVDETVDEDRSGSGGETRRREIWLSFVGSGSRSAMNDLD
ncbi:hypothetical protein ACP275_12G103400 [Erythranthe tilingii]